MLAAAHRVEEVELERGLDVGAAHAHASRRPCAAAADEAPEQIVEIAELELLPKLLGARAARRCRSGCRTPRAPERAFSASKPASSEIAPNSS